MSVSNPVAYRSAAARLLWPHSRLTRRWLRPLSRTGMATQQCGSALALYLYSADSSWPHSTLGQVSPGVLVSNAGLQSLG